MTSVLLIALTFSAGCDNTGTRKTVDHVVKEGDTLWSIAREYRPQDDPRKVVHEIKQANELKSAKIYPGQVLKVEATAYTHAKSGGDINGTGDGRTSIGYQVDRGIVAVDPRVIPYNSILHIPGYGYAVAADTGGAIRGKRIDLFFPSREEALRFGRRQVEVRIVRVPGVRE
ncbi:MAG: LysM peptidoglycan-binding domain-containing protein [Thermoanaerobacteraceae bacterium]|nr:LysM peptidoglycan-binding domain-containing protein [Thermoanaerobacteraceae bacterium]